MSAAARAPGRPAVTITIDPTITHQTIDGFGFSQAFQRSNLLQGSGGLEAGNRRKVLDLLLDRTRGAGFSIVRLGIGSSADNADDHMHALFPAAPEA